MMDHVTPQLFMKATGLEQIAHNYKRAENMMKNMMLVIKRQESVRRTINTNHTWNRA